MLVGESQSIVIGLSLLMTSKAYPKERQEGSDGVVSSPSHSGKGLSSLKESIF